MASLRCNAAGAFVRAGISGKNIKKLSWLRVELCCVLLVGFIWLSPAVAQTVTYIHTDALGSVVAKSDINRNVTMRITYEPYGAVVDGEVTDRPGYAGHVSDMATGLSYMQQRYMDPQLGIYLSVDPVAAYSNPADQFNRYRYANGNPYRFTDPDGRAAIAAPLLIVPIVMGLTYYVVTTPEQRSEAGRALDRGFKGLFQKSEARDSSGNAEADADPNGPFTTDVKPRKAEGGDGASSQHELERDSNGRLVSKTHTVTSTDGDVVHGHTEHVGENGSVRRFSDELTGKQTIGEGQQKPESKDRPVSFPPDPVGKGGRY
jgi:RHS repeat-associated protein